MSSEQTEHSDRPERSELLIGIIQELRKQSSRTVLFHHTIAELLGLNVTDHKCMDFILENGPVTAGRLAELTGLTTGAITGVIDRLEQAKYVTREKDPDDRRRVIIQPLSDNYMKIGSLFNSIAQATMEMLTPYTDQELIFIRHFIASSNSLVYKETEKLKNEAGARTFQE